MKGPWRYLFGLGPPRDTPAAWGEEEPRADRGLPLAADHDPAQASDDEEANREYYCTAGGVPVWDDTEYGAETYARIFNAVRR